MLQRNISVVVEEEELSYDHGSSDFDVDEILNSNFVNKNKLNNK